MRRRRSQDGFSVLELSIALSLALVMLALAVSQWRAYTERQRLRMGVVRVATDVRQAQERAKAERISYRVLFTADAQGYVIERAGGAFRESAQLPVGVTPTLTRTVIFSAFGKPVDGVGNPVSYTITVQNGRGNGTVTMTPAGGVTYQIP